jgi:hypothetical protein
LAIYDLQNKIFFDWKTSLQAFLNPSNRAKIKKANTGICIGFKFLKYVR